MSVGEREALGLENDLEQSDLGGTDRDQVGGVQTGVFDTQHCHQRVVVQVVLKAADVQQQRQFALGGTVHQVERELLFQKRPYGHSCTRPSFE